MNTAASESLESFKKFDAIEAKKDALVEKVEKFFDNRNKAGKTVVPIENAQFQNLLRLAMGTSSIKEIQLFIRYQCARHKSWRDGEFGRELEEQIAEVEKDAGEHRIDLVRLFLGYLLKEAFYRKPPSTK